MNTEPSYPLELLRAELKAALAEQMVLFVDRFASKGDLADLRGEMLVLERQTNGRFNVIDDKLDELLAEKNERDGASEVRNLLRSRRDFWIGVLTAFVVSIIGAAAALAAIPIIH